MLTRLSECLTRWAGYGPLGFLVAATALLGSIWLERRARLPRLGGADTLHYGMAVLLVALAVIVFISALWVLPPKDHGKVLVTSGVYRVVRHPRYAALALLLYPAVGLMLHSVLCLVSTLLAYGAVALAARLEERQLVRTFGQAYRDYMRRTPQLVPRCR